MFWTKDFIVRIVEATVVSLTDTFLLPLNFKPFVFVLGEKFN